MSRFAPYLRLELWGTAVPDSPPGPDYNLDISGRFRLLIGGRPIVIQPPQVTDDVLLWVSQQRITAAAATSVGDLEISFVDGSLTVSAGDTETWELLGSDGSQFVSVAGGGLAEWGG